MPAPGLDPSFFPPFRAGGGAQMKVLETYLHDSITVAAAFSASRPEYLDFAQHTVEA